jgi:hypothetical protein
VNREYDHENPRTKRALIMPAKITPTKVVKRKTTMPHPMVTQRLDACTAPDVKTEPLVKALRVLLTSGTAIKTISFRLHAVEDYAAASFTRAGQSWYLSLRSRSGRLCRHRKVDIKTITDDEISSTLQSWTSEALSLSASRCCCQLVR